MRVDRLQRDSSSSDGLDFVRAHLGGRVYSWESVVQEILPLEHNVLFLNRVGQVRVNDTKYPIHVRTPFIHLSDIL